MYYDTCMIQLPPPRQSPSNGDTPIVETSCSAIFLDQVTGTLLTTASILAPHLDDPVAHGLKQQFLQASRSRCDAPSNIADTFLQSSLQPIKVTLQKKFAQHRSGHAHSTTLPVVENRNESGKPCDYVTAMFNITSGSSLGSGRQSRTHSKSVSRHNGRIKQVWKSTAFAAALNHLMPADQGWVLADDPNNTKGATGKKVKKGVDWIPILLPYFALIQLDDWKPLSLARSVSILPAAEVGLGAEVLSIGTPFGSLSPEVFLNSSSRGVVCNTAGVDQALVLTDARCIPGGEGGALYVKDDEGKQLCLTQAMEVLGGYSHLLEAGSKARIVGMSLMGVVVVPLCWKANEWVGVTIACNLHSILHDAPSKLCHNLQESAWQTSRITTQGAKHSVTAEVKLTDLAPAGLSRGLKAVRDVPVVLVKCMHSWGSGIVVDAAKGLVLTCSHVVKSLQTASAYVRVDFPNEGMNWFDAEVIYCTPERGVFDLALLRMIDWIPYQDLPAIQVADSYQEGDPAYVIGHALFGKELSMKPSITRGVVSKEVCVGPGHMPFIIQSTCLVHAGSSGGPLVTDDGKVIGLVTCNARDSQSGAVFPHINLSVPMVSIWDVIQNYLETSDKAVLENLHVQDGELTKLWYLETNTPVSMQSKL